MSNQIEKDTFFMHRALELAKQAANIQEVPVGAILVSDNNIIVGEGFNCPISSCDPTAHAEIVALRAAAQKLNNYRLPTLTLYVTLEPCIMCLGAILHARIQRLVFGAHDPKTGAVESLFQIPQEPKLNHQLPYTSGILADECSKLLTDFFKCRRIKSAAAELYK